jgi:hypothetical protein
LILSGHPELLACERTSVFGYFKKRNFRKALEKALADGVLTNDEVSYLEERSDELGVDQQYVDRIRREHFNKQVALIKDRIQKTRRLSPDDEARIEKLADDLRMELDIGPEFNIMRFLWAWENRHPVSPEPIAAGILLARNEACYLAARAKWRQVKTFKERAGSSGFSSSIRIMKGLSYRSSTLKPRYRTWEGMHDVSDGTLYVTSKKVMFDGARRSTSIPYGKLVSLQLYTDGIELKKSTGKSDYFITDSTSAEYALALIQHFASNAPRGER